MNKWWADANYLLLFNTVYLFIQTICSWPLIYEIPFYLNNMRFFRTFSVTIAWIYMWFYFIVICDWLFQIYFEPSKTYEDY